MTKFPCARDLLIGVKSKTMAAIGLASLAMAAPANAAYVINFAESGGAVIATGSGSLNVSALTVHTSNNLPNYMTPLGNIFLSGNSGPLTMYRTVNAAPFFGTGATVFPTTSVGNRVGIMSNQFVIVPQNYVSGSDLGTTTTTFANASFASLGLTLGSYVWTWGSGGNADSLTINIPGAVSPVPEPASWGLMILGLGLAGAAMRRRSGRTVRVSHHAA